MEKAREKKRDGGSVECAKTQRLRVSSPLHLFTDGEGDYEAGTQQLREKMIIKNMRGRKQGCS